MSSLSEKIAECVIASAWVKPETRITDTPEIYKLVNPAAPYEFMNGIYRTNLAADREEEIASHHESYKSRRISFRWYSFPHSRPGDLETKLQALNPASITELQGLYVEEKNYAAEIPAGVTVETLSEDNLDDYALANVEAWGHRGAEAERVRSSIQRDFERGEMGYRAFLARYHGAPAATAMLRIVNGAGYLLGGSCRPELRKRGCYRGLVAHRLSLLRSEKIGLALVLARKATSAPICRGLGFQVGCECRSYDFKF